MRETWNKMKVYPSLKIEGKGHLLMGVPFKPRMVSAMLSPRKTPLRMFKYE